MKPLWKGAPFHMGARFVLGKTTRTLFEMLADSLVRHMFEFLERFRSDRRSPYHFQRRAIEHERDVALRRAPIDPEELARIVVEALIVLIEWRCRGGVEVCATTLIE